MLKSFKRAAAITAAALVAGGVGLGVAGTANAAPLPVVSTTTHFSYTVGSPVLDTAIHNLTPGNGTPVEFDLTAAVAATGVPSGSVAGDVANDVAFLETHAGYDVPTASFSIVGGDEMVKLYVTDSHPAAGTFELAATHSGTGLVVPPFTPGGAPSSHGNASVTWNRFVAPVQAKPYVYDGHVITIQNTDATVGFSESAANAPWLENLNPPIGGKCVEVREFGFGFSAADGSPHVGFTCDHTGTNTNEGFLSGLAKGHTYRLQVVPAVGTYASNHPIPNANTSWIEVDTTA